MRTRWIVLNPDRNWIQGDVEAEGPRAAARVTEAGLSADTDNARWDVFEAPAGFPPADLPYSGGDLDLHRLLRSSRPVPVQNSRRRADMAIAC